MATPPTKGGWNTGPGKRQSGFMWTKVTAQLITQTFLTPQASTREGQISPETRKSKEVMRDKDCFSPCKSLVWLV